MYSVFSQVKKKEKADHRPSPFRCGDTTDLEFVEAKYRTDALGDFNQEMELSSFLTVSSTCTFATFMSFDAFGRTFLMSMSLVFCAHCCPFPGFSELIAES